MDQHVPRNEYPRPQLERKDWINLNGEWTYKIVMRPPYFAAQGDYSEHENSAGFDKKIIVPYPPESKLSGTGEKDIINYMFYHRKISIPAEYTDKIILLHFGAVFYHSEIFIDGKLVDFHDGGSSSFTVDISRAVQPGNTHDLVVKVTSNLWDGTIPSGKQSSYLQSYKCFYTRITGIWQTVWMEAVKPGAVRQLQLIPNIDTNTLTVIPEFYGQSEGDALSLIVTDAGGGTAASWRGTASNGGPVALEIPGARLWSPEDPYLYNVTASVADKDSRTVDSVVSYAGMRKVHIADGKIFLNNKPLYQRLVLDQGYYPDGLWTAPDDAALKKDIELGIAAGFNGARLHQKVFEQRYYYWADRLGYICWSESPSWGLDYNTEGLPPRNFLSEWAELVTQNRNHPSILIWTPFNETYQFTNPLVHKRVHRDAYQLCKMIDPSRPVNDASGYIHYVTDVWTAHSYEQDPAKLTQKLELSAEGQPFKNYPDFEPEYTGQPYLMDEYGGIKWDPETQLDQSAMHGQNLVSWGYGDSPTSLEDFYTRLEGLTEAVLNAPFNCGYCYTELTDVEQEKNGIYFYDRSEKFDMDRIRKVFSRVPKGF
ncbi:glycoside hydrolase family 2 protein [Breznakiella homolactica]|uniref:Beta-glucuronidase n=1 Tax=Breznakiella homolactica TaxID=2798577 RepID=A0A7T7XNP9_9SPIR|nr:glycoside hydrolase family 2 TIM barrel-domain containing protein [Breznakiella homolactica]QQO09612.1 hypothetical protein JFL75_01455 [Breznakiella homolactica]